jgi:type II secretory pathway component PulF
MYKIMSPFYDQYFFISCLFYFIIFFIYFVYKNKNNVNKKENIKASQFIKIYNGG